MGLEEKQIRPKIKHRTEPGGKTRQKVKEVNKMSKRFRKQHIMEYNRSARELEELKNNWGHLPEHQIPNRIKELRDTLTQDIRRASQAISGRR